MFSSTVWKSGTISRIFQVELDMIKYFLQPSSLVLIGLGLIIVDVYTQWAGPCDVMKPIINKVKSSVKLILSTSC